MALEDLFGNLNLGSDGSYIPAYPDVDPTDYGWEFDGWSGEKSVAPCLKYTKWCKMKGGGRTVVLKVWPRTGAAAMRGLCFLRFPSLREGGGQQADARPCVHLCRCYHSRWPTWSAAVCRWGGSAPHFLLAGRTAECTTWAQDASTSHL